MNEVPADNIFGRILRGDLPSHGVYSDEQVYAFLDIFPSSPGHTLVVPRSYCKGIADAGSADLAACMQAIQKLLPAIMQATGADGINVVSNNGAAAGQTVEYLHFHLIPRREGDGVRLNSPGDKASDDGLANLAQNIRQALAEGA